jgi:hypothetical protein
MSNSLILELIEQIKRARAVVPSLTRVIVAPKTGEVERIARTSLAQKLPGRPAPRVASAGARIQALQQRAPAPPPTEGGRDEDGFMRPW